MQAPKMFINEIPNDNSCNKWIKETYIIKYTVVKRNPKKHFIV